MHLLLAQSPDNYVWHAEQAVKLYESLYADEGDDVPSVMQRASWDVLKNTANEVLEKAKADKEALDQQEGYRISNDMEFIQEQVDALHEA